MEVSGEEEEEELEVGEEEYSDFGEEEWEAFSFFPAEEEEEEEEDVGGVEEAAGEGEAESFTFSS